MARRRHSPDEVLAKLSDPDVMLADGRPPAEIAKKLEVSEQAGHRWRNQYGGLRAPEVKGLKEFEKENLTLKGVVADQARGTRASATPGSSGCCCARAGV